MFNFKSLEKVLLAIILLHGFIGITKSSFSEFLRKNEEFSINFYDDTIKLTDYNGKNLIFSPFSLQLIGSLLYSGANGKTADSVAKAFGLFSNNDTVLANQYEIVLRNYDVKNESENAIHLANKIYIANNYVISKNFQQTALLKFHSEIEHFAQSEDIVQTAATINHWIEDKTMGRIKEFIDPNSFSSESDDFKMIMVNAIYFRSNWEIPFKQQNTQTGDFFSNKKTLSLDMMNVTGNFFHGFNKGLAYVKVNFNMPARQSHNASDNGKLSMLIVLSQNRHHDDIEFVEQKLKSIDLRADILQNLALQELVLRLPKFKIEFEIDLKKVFKSTGATHIFGDDADYRYLIETDNPNDEFTLNKAIHKSVIEITEDGAEATSASGLSFGPKMPSMEFNIDHPFLYFIMGAQGEIYFIGRFLG